MFRREPLSQDFHELSRADPRMHGTQPMPTEAVAAE